MKMCRFCSGSKRLCWVALEEASFPGTKIFGCVRSCAFFMGHKGRQVVGVGRDLPYCQECEQGLSLLPPCGPVMLLQVMPLPASLGTIPTLPSVFAGFWSLPPKGGQVSINLVGVPR